MKNTRKKWILAVLLVVLAACGDAGDAREEAGARAADTAVSAEQPPMISSQEASGGVAAPRDPTRRPGSIGSSADATQVAATLSEFAIEVTPDTIPAGETTINIENRGERRHIIEVRHASRGRWRTVPIAPGTSVGMSMSLPSGTYDVISTDEDYVGRGMRAALVVR